MNISFKVFNKLPNEAKFIRTTVFVDEFAVDIVNPNNMYSIDAYDNMQTIGDDSGTFTDEKRWNILQSYLNFCYNHSKEPCE